jgi:hypothetical protein
VLTFLPACDAQIRWSEEFGGGKMQHYAEAAKISAAVSLAVSTRLFEEMQ